MPAAPPLPKISTGLEQGAPPSRLRLFGLLAVVVLTAALPLAGASAGPVNDGSDRPAAEKAESEPAGAADKVDDKTDAAAVKPKNGAADGVSDAAADRRSPSLLTGLGLATTARCGPQLASPEGIEAQTCVLRQGRDTWARTYYRNTTGGALGTVLTLMAPGGRTMQITCVVGAEDEPGLCETPRGRTRGGLAGYAAVAEYAADGDAPLLLRSGSNSGPSQGR
ncbi:hypothetical protein ACIREE_18520 [Streptomyces sp. NPDC102467]|uniref:hypothetical protein n=1 Tax=Streptomyces sp. NPDC102467 TaxID=3366179 RepID=UPI00380B868D